MKQCPECSFENIRNRFYCEQCGTLLPSSTSQQVKTPTSRSQEYASAPSQIPILPPSPIPTPHFIAREEPIAPSPSQTLDLLHTTARAMLYLVGALIGAFGLHMLLSAFTSSAIIGFFSFFAGSIVLLTLTFILHRTPAMRW